MSHPQLREHSSIFAKMSWARAMVYIYESLGAYYVDQVIQHIVNQSLSTGHKHLPASMVDVSEVVFSAYSFTVYVGIKHTNCGGSIKLVFAKDAANCSMDIELQDGTSQTVTDPTVRLVPTLCNFVSMLAEESAGLVIAAKVEESISVLLSALLNDKLRGSVIDGVSQVLSLSKQLNK